MAASIAFSMAVMVAVSVFGMIKETLYLGLPPWIEFGSNTWA